VSENGADEKMSMSDTTGTSSGFPLSTTFLFTHQGYGYLSKWMMNDLKSEKSIDE
jgi:hypothetical protein